MLKGSYGIAPITNPRGFTPTLPYSYRLVGGSFNWYEITNGRRLSETLT